MFVVKLSQLLENRIRLSKARMLHRLVSCALLQQQLAHSKDLSQKHRADQIKEFDRLTQERMRQENRYQRRIHYLYQQWVLQKLRQDPAIESASQQKRSLPLGELLLA